MVNNKSSGGSAIFVLLGATLLWGASFSCTGYLVERYSGWTIMWFRMAFALLAFLLLPRKMFRFEYRKGDWKRLLPMALLMPCMYFFLETKALTYTSSIQAGVISSMVPLLVGLGALIFLQEKIKGNILWGMLLSVAGVVLLTLFQDSNAEHVSRPMLGNTLESLAMVSAACSMLLIKDLAAQYNPFSITRLQCLTGLIFFLPGVLSLKGETLGGLTWVDGAIFLFLGVGVSFGAFLLYNIGLHRIPASKASVSINLVPVFALIFGRIFRGESLNPYQLIAAVLVLGGVLWSQKKNKLPPDERELQSA